MTQEPGQKCDNVYFEALHEKFTDLEPAPPAPTAPPATATPQCTTQNGTDFF